jgi:hypothetical protein
MICCAGESVKYFDNKHGLKFLYVFSNVGHVYAVQLFACIFSFQAQAERTEKIICGVASFVFSIA